MVVGCIICGRELGLREYLLELDTSMIYSGPFCPGCKQGAGEVIKLALRGLVKKTETCDEIYPSATLTR